MAENLDKFELNAEMFVLLTMKLCEERRKTRLYFQGEIKMERRNNLQIINEILRIAEKGAKKTHIVYGAKLNFKFLNNYLEKLEEQGLITRNVEPRNKIKTTKKGLMFAQKYQSLNQLISL